jgi:hypothetical protein
MLWVPFREIHGPRAAPARGRIAESFSAMNAFQQAARHLLERCLPSRRWLRRELCHAQARGRRMTLVFVDSGAARREATLAQREVRR